MLVFLESNPEKLERIKKSLFAIREKQRKSASLIEDLMFRVFLAEQGIDETLVRFLIPKRTIGTTLVSPQEVPFTENFSGKFTYLGVLSVSPEKREDRAFSVSTVHCLKKTFFSVTYRRGQEF